MERITIKTKTYSQLETIILISSIVGFFSSAILSNYISNAPKYIFLASLFSLIVLAIKKTISHYENLPLIEIDTDSVKIFEYKNRPFLGLSPSRMVDIKWNNISKFSAANFSGAHTIGKFWYCFEDNKRNIVENFIDIKYSNEVVSLIEFVKHKLDADKINLEGMQ